MNSPALGGFQKIISQLNDPWDWAVAAAGAVLGLGATTFAHGLDGGTLIASGASGGVAIHKTIVASLQRPRLQKRARGILGTAENLRQDSIRRIQEILEDSGPRHDMSREEALQRNLEEIKERVRLEESLWTQDRTPKANDRFVKRLDEIEEELRNIFRPAIPVRPAPSTRSSRAGILRPR